VALTVAKNFGAVQWILRTAIKSGTLINSFFGKHAMSNLTKRIRKIIPHAPLWTPQITSPPSLSALESQSKPKPDIIYFPSCISRVFGTYEGKEKNSMETFLNVCKKTNIAVSVLDVNSSCCGQPFSSKGHQEAYHFTANTILEKLWNATQFGTIPVVIDVSSCTYSLKQMGSVLNQENKAKYKKLMVLDAVEFLHDMVLPKTTINQQKGTVVLHEVCVLEKLKIEDKFTRVAKHFAKEVIVPKNNGCCGMAGDRGFLFPELTTSATNHEAQELNNVVCDGYYASTKTCEMAMSQAINTNYESILYLVDECL
jgi:D-lactate dehydrogenase